MHVYRIFLPVLLALGTTSPKLPNCYFKITGFSSKKLNRRVLIANISKSKTAKLLNNHANVTVKLGSHPRKKTYVDCTAAAGVSISQR